MGRSSRIWRVTAVVFGVVAVTMSVLSSLSAGEQTLASCESRPEFHARWTDAWSALGIAPSRTPESLGDVAAERWFGARNWFPVDGRQQLLCGRLDKWSLYDGTGHELDIHPYIVPGEGFDHIVNELPPVSSRSVRRCEGGRPCVYGEVTSVEPITTWLLGSEKPRDIDEKRFQNAAACAYGPWVMERVHGWLPEIHPASQFWVTNATESTESLSLILSEDSSNRYANPDDFDRFGPMNGKPWSTRSMRETIGIAYEVAATDIANLLVSQEKVFGAVSAGAPLTYPRSLGGAVLNVTVPSWIPKGETESCSVQRDGRTVVRGIEWLTFNVPPPARAKANESAAVVVTVRRSGMSQLVPGDHLRRSSLPPAPALNAEVESAPTMTMEILDDRVLGEDSFDGKLPGTARVWNLPTEDHENWQRHGRQHLTTRVYFTGNSPSARRAAEDLNRRIGEGTGPRVDVVWAFRPTALDPTGASILVGPREFVSQYGVEVSGGDAIRTRAPDAGRPGRLRGEGESKWRSLLVVSPPTASGLSPQLTATATLSAQGLKGQFTHTFHTYFPRFADVARNMEPPRGILVAIATSLKRDGRLQNVSIDDFVKTFASDWAAQSAMFDQPTRRARIFRNAYLTVIRDGDMGTDDWPDLLQLARAYADSRWP